MAKKEDAVKVGLEREYAFGKEVTVKVTTLDDEEQILAQIDKGVSEKKATIALSCGLDLNEVGVITTPDAMKIIEAINNFQ